MKGARYYIVEFIILFVAFSLISPLLSWLWSFSSSDPTIVWDIPRYLATGLFCGAFFTLLSFLMDRRYQK